MNPGLGSLLKVWLASNRHIWLLRVKVHQDNVNVLGFKGELKNHIDVRHLKRILLLRSENGDNCLARAFSGIWVKKHSPFFAVSIFLLYQVSSSQHAQYSQRQRLRKYASD